MLEKMKTSNPIIDVEEYLEMIEDRFDIDSVLNILNKDYTWLLQQISLELLKNKRRFYECM